MNGERAANLSNWCGRDYWTKRPGNHRATGYRNRAHHAKLSHKRMTHRMERRAAKRSCREAYTDAAIPKPMRVRDEDALQRARDRGHCELCSWVGDVCGHHIRAKGAGGADSDDNLVSVCMWCHDKIHRGLISRDRLREIVRNRT